VRSSSRGQRDSSSSVHPDLLSFLDRANIGNARIAGLQKDLKLTNYQFSVVLTCTYVLFIAAEIPMNLVMKKVGANITIPAMTVLWGVVTAAQGMSVFPTTLRFDPFYSTPLHTIYATRTSRGLRTFDLGIFDAPLFLLLSFPRYFSP
jgi:hypothetical protein